MSGRKAPTALPLVDRLRSCMLQQVPRNQTSGTCSSLPYDAADIIDELYEALEALANDVGALPSDLKAAPGLLGSLIEARLALARARGEQQ